MHDGTVPLQFLPVPTLSSYSDSSSLIIVSVDNALLFQAQRHVWSTCKSEIQLGFEPHWPVMGHLSAHQRSPAHDAGHLLFRGAGFGA